VVRSLPSAAGGGRGQCDGQTAGRTAADGLWPQSLGIAIERGDITLLDDAVQTGELLAYESKVLPSGMLRYGAPSGQHDDTVIALGLAYLGAQREGAGQRRSSYGFASRTRYTPATIVAPRMRGED
jgi:hypothetical protein